MAALSTVIAYARTLARTDSNGISDSDGINYANEILQDLRMKLIKAREDLFAQEATRDITTTEINTGASPGKFTFPTDFFFLKNIWVNMTDTTNQDEWFQADQIDVSNLPMGQTTDWLRLNQPLTKPLVDIRGDWFEIFPTPTATFTNAIKIFYFLTATEYTTTGDMIIYPESLNWRILAWGICTSYLKSIENENGAKVAETKYDELIDTLIQLLGTGEQAPTQSKSVPLTGYEF